MVLNDLNWNKLWKNVVKIPFAEIKYVTTFAVRQKIWNTCNSSKVVGEIVTRTNVIRTNVVRTIAVRINVVKTNDVRKNYDRKKVFICYNKSS